ncbi:efflux RND transporter periplasmic adaptor subunit [Lewinella sp. W8]|uniref:efflux RND transporter periplasmic adaptor subunit n=1 Tax=Lewinella sp. W8 TaxID=2528208 RepID=UPI001067EBF8|nr:efflux RND transporter periplasmic adaptor subunit [Lewinella sp. W8]MTB50024.1 efflux RND transporter periplasmic adaptor subunit [Lewinella sp. W8]
MNTRTVLLLIAALGLGLAAGYFLFGGSASVPPPATQAHDHSAHETGGAEIWTCSMHPQIQQDGPGDCPLCGMDLIPLEVGNNTDPAVMTMTEAAVALARVRTVRVGNGGDSTEGGQSSASLTLTGKLAVDERTTAVEVTEFGGRIERLNVSFSGEPVRAGQRIATVYAPDLVVAQEEFLQARQFRDLNPDLVSAARTKLRNLGVTEEQITTLETTGQVIRDFPIYADNSGTILETKAEVGQYLPAGGSLYTYTNLSRLWVLLDAYEADLASISVGDRVNFSVPALPGQNFSARITFVDPAIDPATRTAAVRAEVINRNGRLKPDMFVEGTIITSPARQEDTEEDLRVPRSAVLWTGERSVVYVALPDTEVPTYEFREVTLGDRVGDQYRVRSGLASGDRVVMEGAFQIDAAAQLNNKASMMNRDVLIAGRPAPEAVAEAIPDFRENSPEKLRNQLGRVVEAYLPLKDRLVATATADAALITSLLTALEAVDGDLLTGDARDYWSQQREALDSHAKLLLENPEVAGQREQFDYLSRALIKALTAFGVSGDYYVQHCPMAFNNTGADWISNETQIRNPYFGDLMLKCGLVTDEL